MIGHRPFPKIAGFANVVKHQKYLHDPENPMKDRMYRAKIKIHGTNAGVRLERDGSIHCQQRNDDAFNGHFGFEAWVKENEAYFRSLFETTPLSDPKFRGAIIYGEWAGPGIHKNVAVTQIEEKQFFVFAVRVLAVDPKDGDDHAHSRWITDPTDIGFTLRSYRLPLPERLHVVPWHGPNKIIRFTDHTALANQAEEMNADVDQIDKVDPLMLSMFNVEGHGEGLVYYPRIPGPFLTTREFETFAFLTTKEFETFAFKVKGGSHQAGKGGAKEARVGLTIPANAYDFAEAQVHDARLDQAFHAILGEDVLEMKHTGRIIGWVCKDIADETAQELEEADLTWKQVQGVIAEKVRTAVFTRIEKEAFAS
jgi:hypothetical protein